MGMTVIRFQLIILGRRLQCFYTVLCTHNKPWLRIETNIHFTQTAVKYLLCNAKLLIWSLWMFQCSLEWDFGILSSTHCATVCCGRRKFGNVTVKGNNIVLVCILNVSLQNFENWTLQENFIWVFVPFCVEVESTFTFLHEFRKLETPGTFLTFLSSFWIQKFCARSV